MIAISPTDLAPITGFVRQALRREVERDNPLFQPNELLGSRDYERIVRARTWPDPYELPTRGVLFQRLSRLAYRLQKSGTGGEAGQLRVACDRALYFIDHDRAEDVVRAGNALAVLDEDPAADEVMFIHQLVQEYFAAREFAAVVDPALVSVEWRADRVRPSAGEVLQGLAPADPLPPLPGTGWEETAVLAAAMADDVEAFVRHIMQANLGLAGRCAATAEVRRRLPTALVGDLRWALVERSRNPGADLRDRIACGEVLGELGDPRFVRREGPDGEYVLPPLVEVQGGTYPIGEDEPVVEHGIRWDAHVPRHAVEINPFSIGRFPVTNAEWVCFMASGGYDDERWWPTEEARAWHLGEGLTEHYRSEYREWRRLYGRQPEGLTAMHEDGRMTTDVYELWLERIRMSDGEFEAHLRKRFPDRRLTEPAFWHDQDFRGLSQPVVGLSWYEVLAYCVWLSTRSGRTYRLPTEVEWEAAARGSEARRRPHGRAYDPLAGNVRDTQIKRTTPIGVFPDGDTPDGVCDMMSSCMEWTTSLFGRHQEEAEFGYPYNAGDGREDLEAEGEVRRTARGGHIFAVRGQTLAAFRWGLLPRRRMFDYGLRVVMTGEVAASAE